MKQSNLVRKILDCVAVGDRLAVAVSGGMDSMTLLHAVREAAKTGDFTFFVVNVEHGIRGAASRADSEFVAGYCKENSIEFFGYTADAPAYSAEHGLTLEEGARAIRRSVFVTLLSENKCDRILLAHHMSDQAETVLMRIIRGTGIAGLRGMSEQSNGIARPFLNVSKDEIIAYAQKNNVPYVTDETNLDNAYTRNLIRNEIIPAMKKLSADPEGALVRLSRLATETEEFVEGFDGEIFWDENSAWLIICEGEAPLLFKRRVRRCFQALGVTQDIEERHSKLIQGLVSLKNGASLDMPWGITATREYDRLVFSRKQRKEDLTVPFCVGKTIFNGVSVDIVKYDSAPLSAGELIFDITAIPDDAVLRPRKKGDRFTKFGGGTKSLGDYLTDKKIPKRKRDGLIVCAVGSEVLFIAGVEISRRVAASLGEIENIYKVTTEDL